MAGSFLASLISPPALISRLRCPIMAPSRSRSLPSCSSSCATICACTRACAVAFSSIGCASERCRRNCAGSAQAASQPGHWQRPCPNSFSAETDPTTADEEDGGDDDEKEFPAAPPPPPLPLPPPPPPPPPPLGEDVGDVDDLFPVPLECLSLPPFSSGLWWCCCCCWWWWWWWRLLLSGRFSLSEPSDEPVDP